MKLDTCGKGQVPHESCSAPDSPLTSRGRHRFPGLSAGLAVGPDICHVYTHTRAVGSFHLASFWPQVSKL